MNNAVTFQQLSWLTKEDSILAAFSILQKFKIEAYMADHKCIMYKDLDKSRLDLFKTASSNNIRDIRHPSKASTFTSGAVLIIKDLIHQQNYAILVCLE